MRLPFAALYPLLLLLLLSQASPVLLLLALCVVVASCDVMLQAGIKVYYDRQTDRQVLLVESAVTM